MKEKLKEKGNKMKRILLSILPTIMLFIGCDIDPLSWSTNDPQFNSSDGNYNNDPSKDNWNDWVNETVFLETNEAWINYTPPPYWNSWTAGQFEEVTDG